MIRGTDQEIPEPISLFENHPKMSHLNFSPICVGFQKLAKLDQFWHSLMNFCLHKM